MRAVNQKFWDQSTEVPVTNFKVPVTTFFRNAREISNLPVKILEKLAVKFLNLPVTISENMPVKSQKCPWQNSKRGVSRELLIATFYAKIRKFSQKILDDSVRHLADSEVFFQKKIYLTKKVIANFFFLAKTAFKMIFLVESQWLSVIAIDIWPKKWFCRRFLPKKKTWLSLF